jgi:membrane protein
MARIFRRFVEENFDQISASLAFTTLLSLVPLVALVLGIMSVLPSFPGMVDQLDQFVVRSLLPERSGRMIINHVLEFSQNAANVTVFGLAGLVASVLLLLLSIERTFNHVWGVTENRPWWKKLRLYAGVIALWPFVVSGVVLAIYYAVTTSLGLIDDPEWLRSFVFKAAGLSVAAIFFAGLYLAVPNARVAARDALWAGLFAALGFLLMQKAFGVYLARFPSFTLVYGAFATVPIFLLWLYLSWAVVLLGALVAATLPEFRGRRA